MMTPRQVSLEHPAPAGLVAALPRRPLPSRPMAAYRFLIDALGHVARAEILAEIELDPARLAALDAAWDILERAAHGCEQE